MKKFFTVAAIAAVLLFSGCKSAEESKGDKAWSAAQSETEYAIKVLNLKKAYTFYRQAIKKAGAEATTELTNKYLDATMTRIEIIAENGGVNVDVIVYLREDMEEYLSKDASDDIKDRYSLFLIDVAEYHRSKDDLTMCMKELNEALEIAVNKTPAEEKKTAIAGKYSISQLDFATDFYNDAKKSKDTQDFIRAEYYAKVALHYDEASKEATTIVNATRKALAKSYSAYISVITDQPDKALFSAINKYDILIAVPTLTNSGKATLSMFNNSYNAVRLKKENFSAEYANGKVVQAKSGKFPKKLLDQERELEMSVVFPKKSGKIKKIMFTTKDKDGKIEHYTEKFLF
jgi:outer membrane murein-binding lipoprotein Lpp